MTRAYMSWTCFLSADSGSKQISAHAFYESVSLPDILTQFTGEYFNHEKRESRPPLINATLGSSSLPPNNHGRIGGNTKRTL